MTWDVMKRFASCLVASAMACGPRDRVVALELNAIPELEPFSSPVLVAGLLDATDLAQDPWLSADEREIYFASDKLGSYDIWRSTRSTADAEWQPATVVEELSTDAADLEPAIASDGLTAYFASDRAGPQSGFHIWLSRRAMGSDPWGPPQPLDLGTSATDRGPTLDSSDRILVFASDRGMRDLDLYLATRSDETQSFNVPAPLKEINSPTFDWDPGLYDAGLSLAFASRRDGDHTTSHLYETRRTSIDAQFGVPRPLVELNSSHTEGDPWLSESGRHVVFSSDKDGFSRLYEAWR